MTFDTAREARECVPFAHVKRRQHSNVHNHPHHSTGTLRTACQASGQLSMHTAQSEDRQSSASDLSPPRQ